MIRSLYSAATGMYAQQLNIDNVANNLANVNTNGFKKSRVQFQDLLYQTIKEAGSATGESTQRPTELSVGAGVKPVATQKSFTQGGLMETGNPLDLSINGDGFFQVSTSDGRVFYSRDGAFKINFEGIAWSLFAIRYTKRKYHPRWNRASYCRRLNRSRRNWNFRIGSLYKFRRSQKYWRQSLSGN